MYGMATPLNKWPKKPPKSTPENMNVEYKLLFDFEMILLAMAPPHGPVGPNAHLSLKKKKK